MPTRRRAAEFPNDPKSNNFICKLQNVRPGGTTIEVIDIGIGMYIDMAIAIAKGLNISIMINIDTDLSIDRDRVTKCINTDIHIVIDRVQYRYACKYNYVNIDRDRHIDRPGDEQPCTCTHTHISKYINICMHAYIYRYIHAHVHIHLE